jgi:hypothetical protein
MANRNRRRRRNSHSVLLQAAIITGLTLASAATGFVAVAFGMML